jgi:hypothetical protein
MLLGTGTPAPIVMRGMGERPALVTQGFTTALVIVVAQRVRRRRGRRPKKDYAEYYDEYKISAFLIDINGKELVDPIISKVSKLFETSVKIDVDAKPTNVTHKKSNDFKVWVSKLSIRRDEE